MSVGNKTLGRSRSHTTTVRITIISFISSISENINRKTRLSLDVIFSHWPESEDHFTDNLSAVRTCFQYCIHKFILKVNANMLPIDVSVALKTRIDARIAGEIYKTTHLVLATSVGLSFTHRFDISYRVSGMQHYAPL